MTATSARVAVPAGSSRPPSFPVSRPVAKAQDRASSAHPARSAPSAKAVSVENVVYVDILDRLRESELTLVCHRIIRSEVLKKLMSILDHT